MKNLIVKYLTNEINSAELNRLSSWIQKPGNQRSFEDYVKIHLEITTIMNKPDVNSIKKVLLSQMKKDKHPFYRYRVGSILKYAAVVAIGFGLAYLYQESKLESNPDVVIEEGVIVPKEESITIQLDNGMVKRLDANGNYELIDSNGDVLGSQNDSKLSYLKNSNSKQHGQNTLSVPKGKRFNLVLSDGTQVYLNSGTSLRYPVKFAEGGTRDVFLTGEAYFDVVKNEVSPFIVHADKMNVRVLGTKFNISHYPENSDINTVLVEGSVALYNDSKGANDSTILKPGFKAKWGKSNMTIEVENVDTEIYTAWLEGKLVFRNTSFLRIRKTLERHYNVTIKNYNQHLDAQLFDASFDIETIDEVLQSFSKSFAIDYEIIDNEIVIR